MKEVTKALKGARKRLERGWTQGVFARDAEGENVAYQNETACSFCALGALFAELHELHDVQLITFQGLAFQGRSCLSAAIADPLARTQGVASFNDYPGRTKEEVLDLYDRAIEIAESALP